MSEHSDKKLTSKMLELLKAIQDGQRVYYSPYMGLFNPRAYYRCQALGQCTAQAKALLKRGLVKRDNNEFWSGRHNLELTDAGRLALSPHGRSVTA